MDLSDSNNLIGYFEPVEMPVSELLTGTYHFTIPSYQRGYRWESGDGVNPNEESKQVDDLLNDLTHFINVYENQKNKQNAKLWPNYYLQPLMVKPRWNQAEGYWEWEVLDGQQRLTTMLLILKCLNEMLYGANPKPLYTIHYDNRLDIDFGKISFDPNNKDYDFPLPSSNQDSYYVRKAKDRIEKWYNDVIANNSNTRIKNDLEEALFSRNNSIPPPFLRVLFIWYNVEPVISDASPAPTRIHDIEVFNRLNRGKISLTDSELIKALFILCLKKNGTTQGSLMTEETLVREWDEMGRKFQDDNLWSMICPRNKAYQNRLDLLFDFIRECDNATKDKRSYLYYYKKMNPLLTSPDTKKLETIWNDVKYHFDKLCKWHESVQYHNYIGYLVDCGQNLSSIYSEIKSKTITSLVVLKGMVKVVDDYKKVLQNATIPLGDIFNGQGTITPNDYKKHLQNCGYDIKVINGRVKSNSQSKSEELLKKMVQDIDAIKLSLLNSGASLQDVLNMSDKTTEEECIDYLIKCGYDSSDIYETITKETKSSIDVLKQMVINTLAYKEKSVVKSFFDASGEPDLDSLNYENHYGVIKRALLFFNVATCDKYGQMFPFDHYRNYSYDIEHVNSQTENPIEKIGEKKEWIIQQAFPCLMEDRLEIDKATKSWSNSAATARDLIIEGLQLLRHFKKNGDKDVGDRFKGYRTKVESYYAYGNTSVPEDVISADRHSIGNLTLLNSTINREYKNALYPNKLRTLKRYDQEGVYIPLCTKYLFLKYYTNTSNTTSAFNMMRWRNEDQKDYVNAICFTLKNALK